MGGVGLGSTNWFDTREAMGRAVLGTMAGEIKGEEMGYDTDSRTKQTAQSIIEQWHPQLKGALICYLMHETAGEQTLRTGKRIKIASAAKVTEKMQAADCPFDFIITINRGVWDKLTLDQQTAVLDHELVHCAKDADGYFIRDHEVEEFSEIIERHGFYFEALRQFVEVVPGKGSGRDPKLPFAEDPFKDLAMGAVDTTITLAGGKGVRWIKGVAYRVLGEGEIFYAADKAFVFDGETFSQVELETAETTHDVSVGDDGESEDFL